MVGRLMSSEMPVTPGAAQRLGRDHATSASAAAASLPISSTPTWGNWRSGAIWVPRTRSTWPA